MLRWIGVIILWAQVQEDFSDGDFTTNPPWTGDVTYWQVQMGKLRSNGPATTAQIYLATANALIDNTEWNFWVRVAFNPSTQNYVRVYLVSDRAMLTDPNLQGYYLKLGGISGTGDSLELYRQEAGTHTRLAGGKKGRFGGTNNILRIKVLRDAAGNWEVYSDTLGGVWELEFTTTDNQITSTSHFGFFFSHTSTNRQNLYFDDIYVGPPVVDTDPPQVDTVYGISRQVVRVHFSEAMQWSGGSFSLSPGGVPTSVVPVTSSQVELQMSSPLPLSMQITLTYTNFSDLAGNPGSGNKVFILPDTAVPGDVIFTEIFPDPTPVVGLPDGEFVEIHNRSNKYLFTSNWQVCDPSRCMSLSGKLFPPGGYLILCSGAYEASYGAYGQVISGSFPSLNNDSDSLVLLSHTGELLDKVVYFSSWYRDATKAQGGWTLERIDLHNLCAQDSNWIASQSPTGGTPGGINSVAGTWQDNLPPYLINAEVSSPTTIVLTWNEPLDTTYQKNPALYVLSPSGNVSAVQILSETKIRLVLGTPLVGGTTYILTFRASDCVGNSAEQEVTVGLPEPAQPKDIRINEIYADPDPSYGLPPYEYVEIYNRTEKFISLTGWKIHIGNSSRSIGGLMAPKGYLLLTSEPAAYGDSVSAWAVDLPLLSNSGSTIELRSFSNQLIDRVSYSDKWYKDLMKKNGGYSLELINPNDLCNDSSNWRASVAILGGTPGFQNSVYRVDTVLPLQVQGVSYEPPILRVEFSQALQETYLSQANLYALVPSAGLLAFAPVEGGKAVEILVDPPLAEDVEYTLTISGQKDCQGQGVPPLTVRFFLPAAPQKGDLIINEILFEPQTGGARYIEIYNTTTKRIGIKHLLIGRGDPVYWSLLTRKNVFIPPKSYLCLTEDTADVKSRYFPPDTARFAQVLDVPAYDYSRDWVWLARTDTLRLDSVYYEYTYHFPDLQTRKGVALERVSPTSPSMGRMYWVSAASTVNYGTPGYANSQRYEVADASGIEIEPKTFSPDGDGYDDRLYIKIPGAGEPFRAKVEVYSWEGYKLRTVEEGLLVGSQGAVVVWDGTDGRGRRLGAGFYVIWVEVLMPQQGKVKTYRFLCMIAERIR
ncbi:MAG: lamin tail domain-containing protein [Bacteroidia bacterium]